MYMYTYIYVYTYLHRNIYIYSIYLNLYMYVYIYNMYIVTYQPQGWPDNLGIIKGVGIKGYGVILLWDRNMTKFQTAITRHH